MDNEQPLLNKDFIAITQDFEQYLRLIKAKFDAFDINNADDKNRIIFVDSEKKEISKVFDTYLHKTWEIAKDLDKDSYKHHQQYYQDMLCPLIVEPSEINRHIYNKIFGYYGDYITMNYIYDYNGNSRYLGKSSFEKLMNHYTCNIPFPTSNVLRKEFLKQKISESINKNETVNILTIGCGPARELLELLNDGKIDKKTNFNCLDLEKRALEYVEDQIKKSENSKKKFLNIRFFHNNILDLIRNKTLIQELTGQDLIYVSGVFDYLKDRLAARVTNELYKLLNNKGNLIICNASAENCSHRAYYEIIGDWEMMYRTKDDMLAWTKDIENASKIEFEEPYGPINYLFMNIKHT